MKFKLFIALKKETLLLLRDKVGLAIMFLMPILLVVVITSVQNSTFELVNNNKMPLLIQNKDTGKISSVLIKNLESSGFFKVTETSSINNNHELSAEMKEANAMVALVIPAHFTNSVQEEIIKTGNDALKDFGMPQVSSEKGKTSVSDSLQLLFNPVITASYKQAVNGSIQSLLAGLKNKLMVEYLYQNIAGKAVTPQIQQRLTANATPISESVVALNGSKRLPNATQHNVPAWTLFAMFFMVIALGGNIVKEKLSGSFVRLKVLPTPFILGLFAKQLLYLIVVILLVAVIFTIGILVFPLIGLPVLNLPPNFGALILVTLSCGICAISYALCVGVFANTQEQASGYGAVSVVILAALGGVFVPAFAMPDSFRLIMKLSPFYWGLETYYGVFLETMNIKEIVLNILPLLAATALLQAISYVGLKRKNLL